MKLRSRLANRDVRRNNPPNDAIRFRPNPNRFTRRQLQAKSGRPRVTRTAVVPPGTVRISRAPKTPSDAGVGIRLDEGQSRSKKKLKAARSGTASPTNQARTRDRADPGDKKKTLAVREPSVHRGKTAITEGDRAERPGVETERIPRGTGKRLRNAPQTEEATGKSLIQSLE